MASKFAGNEGFWWFLGLVEDINDPEMKGRIRVRIHSVHEQDKNLLPTDALMWARVLLPITSASVHPDPQLVPGANTHNGGIGLSPTGVVVGSTVFGFFADSSDCQLPIIWGTYGSESTDSTGESKPDICKLAIGQNSIEANLVGPEPNPAYAAKYPYNQVFCSQSGIVVEYDDTPNHERIRMYHPAGTYTEINKDGRLVNKCVDDSFEIIVKDKTMFVKGDLKITVIGDAKIEVDKNADINVKKNCTANVGQNMKVNVAQDMNAFVGGNLKTEVQGRYVVEAGSSIAFTTPGDFVVSAGNILLNGENEPDDAGGNP